MFLIFCHYHTILTFSFWNYKYYRYKFREHTFKIILRQAIFEMKTFTFNFSLLFCTNLINYWFCKAQYFSFCNGLTVILDFIIINPFFSHFASIYLILQKRRIIWNSFYPYQIPVPPPLHSKFNIENCKLIKFFLLNWQNYNIIRMLFAGGLN